MSNYETSINSSFMILEETFRIYKLGFYGEFETVSYMNLKMRVDSILLTRWIIPSRYHVPISRLGRLKRLEVTRRILEELEAPMDRRIL